MLPTGRFSANFMAGFVMLALTLSNASAGVPTPEAVSIIRSKLAATRKVLAEHRGELSEQQERLLLTRLADAERAFEGYLRLVERGKERAEAKAPLYAAGGALLADDLSGAGAADDVLLPFVALALIVAHVKTLPPPSEQEFAVAWAGFLASLQALANATADVAAQRKAGCECKCLKKDVGPRPGGRRPNPIACAKFCDSIGFPGSRCGGVELWPKN